MHFRTILIIVFFALTGNVFAQADSCNMPALPVIHFNKTVFLSKKAKLQLDSVVKIAEQYPNCNISVKGFGTSSVKSQQKSWDQVSAVFKYLEKRGIPHKKLIFNYGEPGGSNKVNLFGTTKKPFIYIGCPARSLFQIKSKHS